MALNASYTKHIEDYLRQVGFTIRRWRHGIMGTRVYVRNGSAVVVIPTIEISPPFIQPVGQSIDDYFKRLCDVLDGLKKRYNITDLFLPGGGNIQLPDWFRDWCEQHRIRMHIVDADIPYIDDFIFEG